MDFLEIRKRAKAQKAAGAAQPSAPREESRAPDKQAPDKPASEVRTESAREALEAPGLERRPVAPPPPAPAAEPPPPAKPLRDPLEEFFFRPDEGAGELEELAAGLEPAHEAPAEEAPQEFLGFLLAGEEYAVELQRIREIVKVPGVTEVPRAPAEIAGVMSVRGEVMPVFDLHKRLGLPAAAAPTRRSRVVIVDVGEGPVGLLVDGVDQVVRIKPSTIEPPPPGLGAGVETEYLAGIGRLRDRMYVLLNLPAVLARPRGLAGERR